MVLPSGTVVRNLPASAGDTGDAGLIPGLGRSPGGGNGGINQNSCLKNPGTEEPGCLQCLGITKSRTPPSDTRDYRKVLVVFPMLHSISLFIFCIVACTA